MIEQIGISIAEWKVNNQMKILEMKNTLIWNEKFTGWICQTAVWAL